MRRTELLDRYGATTRIFHWNEAAPDQFVIESQENITAVLEKVQRERENREAAPLHDMKHVAEVPMSVVERAMREGWFNDPAAWKKFLNDPDNSSLRVERGHV